MRTDASVLGPAAVPVTDGYADLEGVRLHYVTAGEGPLVVLLHGFPQLWYAWRHQIVPLAQAGFRVVAVDMRGYNLSSKPAGIEAYGTRAVAGDVAALVEALGERRAHVVGHDWGSGIAWAFAMGHPDKLDRLALLNGPHPKRMLAGLKDPVQLARSWYMFFFQLPWLPEAVLRLDGYKVLKDGFRHPSVREGTFTAADLEVYGAAYAQPGALAGMLGYYRAMMRPGLAPRLAKVEAPVLSVWGARDPFLGRELATPPPDDVPDARVVIFEDASHWIQEEAPAEVTALLVEHFAARS